MLQNAQYDDRRYHKAKTQETARLERDGADKEDGESAISDKAFLQNAHLRRSDA